MVVTAGPPELYTWTSWPAKSIAPYVPGATMISSPAGWLALIAAWMVG